MTKLGESKVLVANCTKQHYDDVKMGTMASQLASLTIIYSIVYSGTDQRKHQSSASLAFVQGIHRGPVNSPHKGPVTRKIFPFDDVFMNQDWFQLTILTLMPECSVWMGLYHGYRCPGFLPHQLISSHGVDSERCMGPCVPCGKFITIYAISMLRQGWKCIIWYIFSRMNVAR